MPSRIVLIAIAVLASIGSLVLGPSARAQSDAQALDLQWNAPDACLSAGSARAAIAALIGAERAGEPAQARVLIEGSEKQGYRARIEIARGQSGGERELRGARCREVAEAAVLIIAMTIDPEGAAARGAASDRSAGAPSISATAPTDRNDASQPAAEVSAPIDEREATPIAERAKPNDSKPEPEEAPEPEETEEKPSDPRDVGRLALGLRGSGDAGSLPRATIGAGLLAGVHWQHLRVELQALAYLPQLEATGPQPGSTEIELYTAAITGCLDVLGAREAERALGACAALEAGLSSGTPRRVSDGRARSGPWLASFFGLEARQRLIGPLHLRMLAEAGLPVLRPSYEIAPFGRIFRASPVLGRFGISVFMLLP